MATTAKSLALTDRYQAAVATTMRRASAIAAALWQQVQTASEQAEDEFVGAVVPSILGAQHHVVTLTDAYMSLFVSLETRKPIEPKGLSVAALIGATVRGGTPLDVVYRRPFGVARGVLAKGESFADAMSSAQARLVQTASTDVGLSARAARSDWMAGDDQITGWRRVTGGTCCALCVEAASKTYRTSDLMPIHPGCGCVTEPVVLGARHKQLERPEPTVEDSPALADDASDPTVRPSAVVKVVEHGELGPVLYAAGDDFVDN